MVRMCQAVLIALVAVLLAIYFGTSFFHGPSCPLPEHIQTEYVKSNFDLHKFQGVWYEAAFHDWTQPASMCSCIRSVKHYRPETDYVFDNFTLHCYGDHYFANLTFDLTAGKTRGHMIFHWIVGQLHLVDFPNTVVALGVNEKTGEYEWVIEYQCVQVWNQVIFAGVNFYHRQRTVAADELQRLITIARQQGIGYWLDHGLGISVVNHSGCTYPPIDEEVALRLNITESLV